MRLKDRKPISEEFFQGKAINIAENLIGKFLFNEETECGGTIVETEAYLGKHDPSCHYAKNKNGERRKTFENGAGTVYVYNIHTHNCLNFISEFKGNPEGILVRAIKPEKGIKKMKERRGWNDKKKLASGPGKLTEALGISKEKHNNEMISESPIKIYGSTEDFEIETSSRIGISKASDWPARFIAKNSEYLSKSRKGEDHTFNFETLYRRFN